jgi:hypothetical protein
MIELPKNQRSHRATDNIVTRVDGHHRIRRGVWGVSSKGKENWNEDEEELCSRPAHDYPETTKWTPIA